MLPAPSHTRSPHHLQLTTCMYMPHTVPPRCILHKYAACHACVLMSATTTAARKQVPFSVAPAMPTLSLCNLAPRRHAADHMAAALLDARRAPPESYFFQRHWDGPGKSRLAEPWMAMVKGARTRRACKGYLVACAIRDLAPGERWSVFPDEMRCDDAADAGAKGQESKDAGLASSPPARVARADY